MDKYTVKLMPRAYRDLDEIYVYIAAHIGVKETAVQYTSKSFRTKLDKAKNYLSLLEIEEFDEKFVVEFKAGAGVEIEL